MFAQIGFKLAQKLFASGAILGALHGIRVNSVEIITSDKQVAGETAAVLERIARGLRKLERLALALGHLRCVDDCRSYRLFGLCARFLGDLFFRRFEWRFHFTSLSFRAKSRNPAEQLWIAQRDV